MAEPQLVSVAEPVASDDAGRAATRRLRFRQAVADLATRSESGDLLRWILLPAAVFVIGGFNFMLFGWYGASHTAREIEQIPYLISGGIVGLALVFLGGLLLAAAFSMVLIRKLLEESEREAVQPDA